MFIFETLGGMHNQKTVERVYLENKRDPETTMDLFLTGAIQEPKKPELHVVIEPKKEESKKAEKVEVIDTTVIQIQQ